MNEHELDRAIDRATRHLVVREPRRALTYNVMARVREGVEPASRRLVWASAAASVLVCAAIAILFLYRAPQNIPLVPPARPFAIGAQPITPAIVMRSDLSPAPHSANSSVVRRATPAETPLPLDVSSSEPLEPEPISVVAIDVWQIDREAPKSIEALKIDELTIEPLAASND